MSPDPQSPLARTLPTGDATSLATPVSPQGDVALAHTLPAAHSGQGGTAVSTLARGSTLGRYIVLDRVGEGGMGVVYTAYDPELDRKLAVKLLRPDSDQLEESTEGRARLLREGQAMARLSHPNVIPVHDVGTYAGEVFIAMELVEGGTLRAWLSPTRSWREIVAMFVQAGRGLAAAHDAGIVHRDFKADNVLVGRDGRARVVDFGLAHAPDGVARAAEIAVRAFTPASPTSLETPLTREGALVGTPRYMAPEQLTGDRTEAAADQFSFAVSLYEALYGLPPFEGDNLVTLSSNVQKGRIREVPAGGRSVPGWVRQVLHRGLSVRPRDRYLSMHALLEALERDPAIARRRWLLGGAGAAAIAVAAAGLGVARARRALPCPSAEPELAGAWDGAQERAVHAAFRATGAPFAEDAFRGTSRALDAYAAKWVAARGDACSATLVRGEQSSELMDLRMACLDERLAGLRALTSQLGHADSKVVEGAVQAADALAPIQECSDTAALRGMRLPPEPATRARIEGARRHLAEVRAIGHASKPTEALQLAEEAVANARDIGYRPLEAEALEVLGVQLDLTGDEKRAVTTLEDAVLAAVVGRYEALETRAWIDMVHAYGIDLKPTLGRAAAKHGHACLERGGESEEELARLLVYEGLVAYGEGKYDEARGDEERALAIHERKLPPDHPDIAAVLNELGNEALDEGKTDEALAYQQRALAIREKAFGPAHPLVATSLNNLGNALRHKGDLDGAIDAHRRSLAIKLAAFGEDNRQVAHSLTNLGLALLDAAKPAEALDAERRAATILEHLLGPDHLDVGDMLGNLAGTQLLLHRWDGALASARRMLEIDERAYGPSHPFNATPLTEIGDALFGKGDAAAALPYFERALPLAEARGGQPRMLAGTREGLARALVATRGDPVRARKLAMLARAEYVAEGAAGAADVAKIDADFPPR